MTNELTASKHQADCQCAYYVNWYNVCLHTDCVDDVAHRNQGETNTGRLHACHQVFPLVQLWTVNLSNVDHLLLCLAPSYKYLLAQKSSSWKNKQSSSKTK